MMKRILLYQLGETVASDVLNRLEKMDFLVIASQMTPAETLFEMVLSSQAHVAVAAQWELDEARSHLWTFTQSLAAERYDFSKDGVDRLVADVVAMPENSCGGLPGERVVGVGSEEIFRMNIPFATDDGRQKILARLGVLRATAQMREPDIRRYHELAARYLDRVSSHSMSARLPTGARLAALRGCLARALGALAHFLPWCDPESLPLAGSEIEGVLAIHTMPTPQSLYAVECIRRQMPGDKVLEACRHALLTELPGGMGNPVEKQMAVLTHLCRLYLRAVSDLLLTLIDAPRVKVRQVTQARARLTAFLGLCFAEVSWEEIVEAGDAAGPLATYGFGQFLLECAGDSESEVLACAS